MVNLHNPSPWFRTAKTCPVSGLPVSHPEMYISRHPKAKYVVDVAKLGDRILLVKASGYVRFFEMDECLKFMDVYVSKYFDAETGVLMVEDYVDVDGADAEARRMNILHHKNSPIFWGGIFYNLSPLFRFSVNISKRLHVGKKYLGTAESYAQAVTLAQEVIRTRAADGHGPGPDADSLTFLKKSSEKASHWYRQLMEGIQKFSRSAALIPSMKIRHRNTDALLRYIESIDWFADGIKDPEGAAFSDPLMQQVAAAISYIKSEMDDLLRERDAREKILMESEARYRRLVEHARAGILEFDYTTHRIISVNDSFLKICGYSKPEITDRAPEDLMSEKSRKLFRKRLKLRLEGKPLPDDAVYEFFTKTGEKKWVLLTATIIQEGGRPQKADIIIIDITPIKTAEARLMEYQARLKALSMELSRAEERERRNLASQLHEGVSQELFVAQLKLAALKPSLSDPAQLQGLAAVNDQIVKSIREIKSITYDLSPPVLYDLGLPDALESLARTFASRHGLKINMKFKGESGGCNDEIRLTLYRVAREALQNVVKHARADQAAIFLEKTEDDVFMDITDNGVGFDTAPFAENHYTGAGFGLFDIRERITNLGGNLRICSTPGEGTRLSLAVPLSSNPT